MLFDKMVSTKWYGQNGTDKMVSIFGIDYDSREFNTYLLSKRSQISDTQRKPKGFKWKRD